MFIVVRPNNRLSISFKRNTNTSAKTQFGRFLLVENILEIDPGLCAMWFWQHQWLQLLYHSSYFFCTIVSTLSLCPSFVYHNYRSTEILCKKLFRCLNSLTNNVHSLNSSSNCSLDNIPDIRSRTVTYLLMFKRWYKIRSGSLETEKWSVNAWGRHQLTVTCWCRANVCLLSAFQEAQRCKINGSSTLPHILLLFLIVSTFFAEWQFVNNF